MLKEDCSVLVGKVWNRPAIYLIKLGGPPAHGGLWVLRRHESFRDGYTDVVRKGFLTTRKRIVGQTTLAYSDDSASLFRAKSTGHSGRSRSPIPEEGDNPWERSDAGFLAMYFPSQC